MTNTLVRAAVASLAVAITLGGLAVSRLGAAEPTTNADGPSLAEQLAPRERVPAIPEAVQAAYASLRGEGDSADRLPDRLLGLYADSPSTSRYGVNTRLARRLATADGSSTYFLPGDGYGCGLTTDAAATVSSCAPISDFIARGTFIGSAARTMVGGRRLQGIAPDRVATVRILRYEGRPVTTAVDGNAYAVEYGGLARVIEFVDYEGTVIDRHPIEER